MTTVKCSEICKTSCSETQSFHSTYMILYIKICAGCTHVTIETKRVYAVGSVRWEMTLITSGFHISPMITHIQNFEKEEGPTSLNHSCDSIYVSTTVKCICHHILYVTYIIRLYDTFSIISFHLKCICFGCRSYGLRVKGTTLSTFLVFSASVQLTWALMVKWVGFFSLHSTHLCVWSAHISYILMYNDVRGMEWKLWVLARFLNNLQRGTHNKHTIKNVCVWAC